MACVFRREKINALNAFVCKALRAGEKGWLKITQDLRKIYASILSIGRVNVLINAVPFCVY